MGDRSLRGKVAVVGIGETAYYKHGQSPDSEFKMALQAILAACSDAGIDAHAIDGFASYSDDRSDAVRLATALGIPRLRSATMQWGGRRWWLLCRRSERGGSSRHGAGGLRGRFPVAGAGKAWTVRTERKHGAGERRALLSGALWCYCAAAEVRDARHAVHA